MTRDELKEITLKFTDAFNATTLDGVMAWSRRTGLMTSFMADGTKGKGGDPRAAFEPDVSPANPAKVRFEEEDLFLEAQERQGDDFAGSACSTTSERSSAWRRPPTCCMSKAAESSPSTPTPRRRALLSRPAPPNPVPTPTFRAIARPSALSAPRG